MGEVMKQRKRSFWEDTRFHDIFFSFEDSDQDLGANKMILALVSPVFEAMFYGDFEQENLIAITDIEFNTFRNFLYLIYTENFTILSFENAQQLFYVANKYEVVDIENACETYLREHVRENPKEVLKFAEMFSLKNLENLSRMVAQNNPDPTVLANWRPHKKGDPFPTNMVFVGYDDDNYPIGVGRFKFFNDLLPGALSTKDCSVESSYSREPCRSSEEIEILCDGNLEWIEAKLGIIPSQSVVGGVADYANRMEDLGVAKCQFKQRLIVGKVHPSHRCMYFGWEAEELRNHSYLHLVDRNIDEDEMYNDIKNLFKS